jgi:hypothetical protein
MQWDANGYWKRTESISAGQSISFWFKFWDPTVASNQVFDPSENPPLADQYNYSR